MPSYVPPKKNDSNGYITYVSLRSQADAKVMQANPTLAAGDVKIAVDDAAPGNLGTLPVVDADFTKRAKVTLSQAETNGDNLTIIFSDAAGAEWCDLTINIQTSTQTLDEIETDVAATHVHAAGAETQATAAATDASAAHIQADHIHDTDLPAVKTDTAAILVDTGTTLDGKIDTVDTVVDAVKAKTDLIPADITTQLDTNVPAIKAKTDLLPADTATQIDTNIPAIKAKTDLIPADIATQLDTNIPAILADTGTDGVVIPQAQADKVWGTATRALTDKAGFTISGTKTTLDALNDISAAYITSEVDDLITRVKGLDAIYDSVALRALEATLTAIKGAGWTTETLKAIKDAIDALVTGGATAQEVWEYITRTLTATPESFVV